ncbi:MAG: type I methionyl aminopeptidase [Candidatus Vogelbacteria bacterium]
MAKNKLNIKSSAEIEILRAGGRELAKVLAALTSAVRPGITTRSLDTLARELIHQAGGEPSFLNYRPVGAPTPYPAALCVSVNDEVVHGIPGERVLEVGDLVGLDLGLKYHGLYTDMAVTVAVGEVSAEAQALLDVTRQALSAGIVVAKAGATTGDIGFAVATAISDRHKYGIVTEFGGHGVGHRVHESPEIPNVSLPGSGERLVPGLVIAIEPMIIIGSGKVITADDGWTVKTKQGGLSAHFEHTVLVTNNGGEILTKV